MTRRHTYCLATLLAALAVQGCTTKPPVQEAVFDPMDEGKAKVCTPSNVSGGSATIAMSNDGWCGVTTADTDGQPFSYGRVRARPANGRITVQRVGPRTRIEYTPNAGFTGADKFSVALRSRAASAPDTEVQVAVDVAQGDGPVLTPAAASAPPAQAERPASRTPASRTPARNAPARSTPARRTNTR